MLNLFCKANMHYQITGLLVAVELFFMFTIFCLVSVGLGVEV